MTRSEIKRRVKFWQGAFFLQGWKIEVVVVKQLTKWKRFSAESTHPVAETAVHFQYLRATIEFMECFLHEVDDEVILHEVLHIVLSPMTQFSIDNMDSGTDLKFYEMIEEQQIELLTRAIVKMKK
jgi:hypothetical protein